MHLERLSSYKPRLSGNIQGNYEDKRIYETVLRGMEFAYNVAVHSSTLLSPFGMLVGYRNEYSLDVILGPQKFWNETKMKTIRAFQISKKYRKDMLQYVQDKVLRDRINLNESRQEVKFFWRLFPRTVGNDKKSQTCWNWSWFLVWSLPCGEGRPEKRAASVFEFWCPCYPIWSCPTGQSPVLKSQKRRAWLWLSLMENGVWTRNLQAIDQILWKIWFMTTWGQATHWSSLFSVKPLRLYQDDHWYQDLPPRTVIFRDFKVLPLEKTGL